MKKKSSPDNLTDEMRPHYDFDYSKAKPNRFASRFPRGRVVAVVLDSDVAEVFDSSESVNRALRAILSAVPPRPTRKKAAKKPAA